MNPGIRFDEHQFIHRARAISQESGIAFADYNRMGTFKARQSRFKRWIPEWSQNDETFRAVVQQRALQYALGGHKHSVATLTREQLETITAKRTRRFARRNPEHVNYQRHTALVEHVGGHMKLLTQILWLSYRMGYTSPDVAETIGCGLTPWAVRIQLYRASQTARKLGFPVFEREHHTRGIKHKGRQ